MARKSDNTALNNLADRLNSGLLDNKIEKSVTFAAGSTGKLATGTFKIATVTGVVAMSVFAVNTGAGALTGPTATLEVGCVGDTAALIALTTITTIDSNEVWYNNTPVLNPATSVITQKIVTKDVNYLIKTADITGGTLTFFILWAPISANGKVEIA